MDSNQNFGSLLNKYSGVNPDEQRQDSDQFGSILSRYVGPQPAPEESPKPVKSGPSTQSTPPVSAQEFVRSVEPAARKVAQQLGVPVEAVIGQWGLETGWGKSVIPGSNNLGNIKDFSGNGVAATDNMTGSRDKYRQYGSVDDFAQDFTRLLGTKYKAAGQKDAAGYFNSLKAGGYAEDPDYVNKGVSAANMAAKLLAGGQQPTAAPAKPGQPTPAETSESPGLWDSVKKVAGNLPSVGDAMNTVRDFATGVSADGQQTTGSVLEGRMGQAPELPSASKVPVERSVRLAEAQKYDKATPEQRKEMLDQPGWRGMLARERAGQYEQLDQTSRPGDAMRRMDQRAEVQREYTGSMSASPARQATLGELASDVWSAAKGVPNAFEAAAQAFTEGGDAKNIDWKNKAILESQQRTRENSEMVGAENDYALGITREKVRNLPQNLAFSILSMGAGIAAGIPAAIAGNVFAPVAGTVAGFGAGAAASGAAAYRMDTNGFLREIRANLDQGAKKAIGRALTDEEFIKVADKYAGLVNEHGLWEALPEALGNVVSFGAGKMIFKAAEEGLKKSLLKTAQGVGVNLMGELGTETITQTGQHNTEIDAGLQQGAKRSFANPADLMRSAQEVLPDVLLLTGVTSGAAYAGGKVSQAYNTPERQIANEINRGVRGTTFTNEGIQQDVLNSLNPDKSLIDPTDTVRSPTVVGPSAPIPGVTGLAMAPPEEPPAEQSPTAQPPSAQPPVTQRPVAEKQHPTSSVADAIVREAAQAHGIPESAVLPQDENDDGQITDDEVVSFAQSRYQQLREKRDGRTDVVADSGGLKEQKSDPQALTPAEQKELAGLEAGKGDVAALRALYGMGSDGIAKPVVDQTVVEQPVAEVPTTEQQPTAQPPAPVSQQEQDADVPDLDAPSNVSEADAMRALGFTEDEIAGKSASEPNTATNGVVKPIVEPPDPVEPPKTEQTAKEPPPVVPPKPKTEREAKEQREALGIITHTTAKGKILRGKVFKGMTLDEAKAYDKYAFKKDGGVFIREEHILNNPELMEKTGNEPQANQAQQTETQRQEAPAAPAVEDWRKAKMFQTFDEFEFVGPDGVQKVTLSWSVNPDKYREIYGVDGAILNIGGMNGVPYQGPTDLESLRNWAKAVVVERAAKAKPAKPKTEKEAKEQKAEPRGMDFEGRPTDGKPVKGGDVFRTASGRVTTAYPTQKSEKYATQWLIDNAVAEAESRGDKFNATQFKAETPNKSGTLPPASIAAMQEYLFGQQPKVVQPVLKPLAPRSESKAVNDFIDGKRPEPPSVEEVAAEKAANPPVSGNTVFTDDMAAKARERLKAKLNRLNTGLDPEMMQDGITLAGYHIEKGARTFAAYAKAMIEDMGEAVKPYLKSWYMGVKYDPRAAGFTGMDSATDVDKADVDDLKLKSQATEKEAKEARANIVDDENPDENIEARDGQHGWREVGSVGAEDGSSLDVSIRDIRGANQVVRQIRLLHLNSSTVPSLWEWRSKRIPDLLDLKIDTAMYRYTISNQQDDAFDGIDLTDGDAVWSVYGNQIMRMLGKIAPSGSQQTQKPGETNTEVALPAPVVENPSITAMDLHTPEGKFKVAKELADFFIGGGSFKTIIEARKKISEMIGRPIEAATELAKQADETIETAVVLAGREMIQAGRKQGRSPQVIYDRLLSLYNAQPNLAVRSSTSVREQAYSTPIPLAYLASELAGITYDTKVLEPTAGNGMLLVGASLANSTANELNTRRLSMLQAMGFKATQKNAATEQLRHSGYPVDAVIANPPFGITKDENGETVIHKAPVSQTSSYETREVDHAIAFNSLLSMKDDGRAVLIVGGSNETKDEGRRGDYRGKSKRTFYFNLYGAYNVTDHFTVDGSLYSKQGASYPVDVIVIEGRGKATRALPAAELPQIITSYEALKEKLNGTRSVGTDGVRGTDGTAGSEGTAGTNNGAAMVGGTGRPGDGTGQGSAGVPATSVPGAGSTGNGQPAGGGAVSRTGKSEPSNTPESGGAGRGTIPGDGNQQPAGAGSNAGNGSDKLGGVSVVNGERVESGLTDRRGEEQETETQVEYTPHSRASSVGTLVPRAMRDAIDASLQKIEDQLGNLDEYVGDRLAMDPETVRASFSAEQVDALALAIKNAEEGRGFIIGDQTGIGKGRVVAAMIRYAIVNDKTPIFVTEKPNLYSDMIRDLDDIGMTDDLALDTKKPKIFITNGGESIPYTLMRTTNGEVTETNLTLKAPKSGKDLDTMMQKMMEEESLGDYRVIFTTYSQLQTVKGKDTQRQKFVRQFGSANFMIFDESHNAGGAGETQARTKGQREAEKKGESLTTGRASFVRNLVTNAFGTFFSSATYAKRPDVMDLYSSTNMKLSVDKISQLGDAIKNGGVPMQQVVANMLTTDGQYIRRERTFAGVSYETKETTVDKQTAENMAAAMRSILAFSRAKEAVVEAMQDQLDAEGAMVKAMGGESMSVQGANFGSIMHNLIDQMLLSLKTQSSVQHAIERLKAGEKVVMTVSNTMGSFLKDYAEEMGLNMGDPVGLTFKDLYDRYLEKQRIITVKDGKGLKTKKRLTDKELGPMLTNQFNEIRKQIENAGFGSAPISPIDYLHSELRKAGFTTDEITGRSVTLNYESGTPVLTSRTANIRQRVNAVRKFNSGEVDVIILNQAGSTGLSLHASSKFKDQRKRHMIIVQAEKNIDTHMQMLGRVHRTGQIVAPAYSQMMADIPAEMRPAAVLLKKMASLNANTTASRKSAVTAEGVVDFMNDYGGQVVHEYLRDTPEVLEAIGGSKVIKLVEDLDDASEDDIRKFTGYIPILPIEQQESIYRDLIDRYNELIERENTMGTNKLEAKAIDMDAETVSSTPITENKGDPSIFASPANMEKVDVKRTVKPYSSDEVQAAIKENLDGKAPRQAQRELQQTLALKGDLFKKERLIKMKAADPDEIKLANARDQLNMIMGHTGAVLENYKIGDSISVKDKTGQIIYGVITNMTRAGRTANPASPSDWKMQIALANGDAKSLTINFGQIGSRYQLAREGMVQWYNAETQKIEPMSVTEIFDKGSTLRREKRWMVTGNILAGFAKFPGQIITYTKKDGTIAQGVLMSRQFDFEKELKSQPVRAKDGTMAMKFLDLGANVGVEDGTLRVNRVSGKINFIVPSSKREGGTYYLDQELTSALGVDFYKRGSTMVAAVWSPESAIRAFDYLINGRNEAVVALSNTDRVKAALEKDGGLGSTSGDALPRFVAKYGNNKADIKEALYAAEQITGVGFDTQIEYREDLPVDTPMRVNLKTRVIEINSNIEMTQAQAVQYLIEELLHRVDVLSGGKRSITAGSKRFHPLTGDIGQEAMSVYQSNKDGLSSFFYYPLNEGLGYDYQRIRAELFARMGTLYFADPEHFKRVFPNAYNFYNAIFPITVSGDSRILQKVWGQPTGLSGQIRGEYGAGGSTGQGSGQGGGGGNSIGLERLRAKIGRESLAAQSGTILQGVSLDTKRVETNIDPDTGEISQQPSHLSKVRKAQNSVMQFWGGGDKVQTFGIFSRTIATQYHKAMKDKHYGKVFSLLLGMENHVSMASIRSAELAPGVMPRVDDIASAAKAIVSSAKDAVTKHKMDALDKAGMALFSGTLDGETVLNGRVWTDDELRSKFGADDTAIALYRQTRAAVDKSLDEVASAEAYALAASVVDKSVRADVIENPGDAEAIIVGDLQSKIKTTRAAVRAAKRVENDAFAEEMEGALSGLLDTKIKVERIFNTAKNLKAAGYMPLMRFGKFDITVYKKDPESGDRVRNEDGHSVVLFYGRYESKREMQKALDQLRSQYGMRDDVEVTPGTVNPNSHEMYTGVTPETLELFADAIGAKRAADEFIRLTRSERSALKRRLERKGTPGFSTDLQRVLASFITSNARHASQQIYGRAVSNAIKYIPKEKGDVQAEAMKLRDYVMNPQDAGSGLSTIMFSWFMGGSVASAMVNLTQPVQSTLPYLTQFDGTGAATEMAKAVPAAMGKAEIKDPELRNALKRASLEGVVDAQEIFHLYALGSRRLASNANTQAALTLWGSMFAQVETFNRRLTFIAAWNVAIKTNQSNPYGFAIRAVNQTQGIYNKVNRPNLARSTVGRAVFTFKQFSIFTTEMLIRMWKAGPAGKRAVMIFMAIMFLAAGEEGLWGAKALDDLIDTLGQLAGFDTNMKRWKRSTAHKYLGKELGDFFLYGASVYLPLDFGGRLGMGNVIPGTELLKPSSGVFNAKSLAEIAGATTGFARQVGDAAEAAAEGNYGKAATNLAPKAIRDVANATSMVKKGYATDAKGRKTVDTDNTDAAVKAIGFNPTKIAQENRKATPVYQDVALQRMKETSIVNEWVRGIVDGDNEMAINAQRKLAEWNKSNPNTPINITREQIQSRVRAALTDRNSRMIKAAPKEMRGKVAAGLSDIKD